MPNRKNILLIGNLFIDSSIFGSSAEFPQNATGVIIKNIAKKIATAGKRLADSTVILFNDKSYRLTIHIFDEESNDEKMHNAVLSLVKQEKTKLKVIFADSLHCMYPDIDFRDFKNDNDKDVLVFSIRVHERIQPIIYTSQTVKIKS